MVNAKHAVAPHQLGDGIQSILQTLIWLSLQLYIFAPPLTCAVLHSLKSSYHSSNPKGFSSFKVLLQAVLLSVTCFLLLNLATS